MSKTAEQPRSVATDLESRPDVVRAVSTWDGCDVAVLVEDGTDLAPIRRDRRVVGTTDFGAAPYTLVELETN